MGPEAQQPKRSQYIILSKFTADYIFYKIYSMRQMRIFRMLAHLTEHLTLCVRFDIAYLF
jgi:hypothetical protein